MVIELVQEAFMLRDDILDGQKMCVKRKTVYNLLGEKQTNLIKDILFSEARKNFYKGLEKIDLSKEIIFECLKLFEEMILCDVLGQWMDIQNENLSYRRDLERQYFRMISYTPGIQFKNIASIAYIISGKVSQKHLVNIQNWGLNFGIAAQLRDDIIDIIGDETVVFKNDVLRRKKRLPLIKFLENSKQYPKVF